MVGPPSLEEAVGCLTQEEADLVAQRLGQVGVNLGAAQARMAEQDRDDPDIDATLEQVGGEAVTQRVGPELGAEAAGVARLDERGARGGIGEVGHPSPAGKEPASAAVGLPDLAKHLKDGIGQGENPLLVALADDVENHLAGINGGDRQSDGLVNPQAIGVDQRKTATIDRQFQSGDQAAAVLVTADVGETLAAGLADFFGVNRGQL
jgi:hypothetical protein